MNAALKQFEARVGKAGWASAPLRELCEFHNGLWKGKKGPLATATVIRNTNFTSDGRIDLADVAVLEVEEWQLAKRRLQKNDIIIEKSGGGPKQPVGRVVLFGLDTDEKYSFSNFTSAIRIAKPDKVDPVYLHRVLHWWYTSGQTEPLQSHSTGIRNLDFNAYKELVVPLPSLDEQKRIVAVLDQAFAALDRARANAEANLADAHELFGAALNAVIRRSSHQQQKKLRLGSIVTRLTNGYVGPIRNIYVDAGVPYLLARHVRNNTLAFDGRTYISPAFNEKHKKSKLKSGDVLLVQSGHIGHSAVVPEAHAGHNCHAMIVISPKDEIVSGPYLSMMFNTPAMQETFQDIRTGSTVPHLTCKMVKELMVEIPPREVQSQIMATADELGAKIAVAVKRYKTDVFDIAALRQSLLQKAFAGEL